ncbi:hypothetical protein PoB_004088800 [Plakobranchus ocellatus]|uniref:Uncharacterized protein n=1 Tax=Plakobranchus ocellatus TaxID=259542 RepID=A0AAV4B6H1_9GAST|nr:hypothetical protein PoB_004088800 [Plakobranchus ocellatus]
MFSSPKSNSTWKWFPGAKILPFNYHRRGPTPTLHLMSSLSLSSSPKFSHHHYHCLKHHLHSIKIPITIIFVRIILIKINIHIDTNATIIENLNMADGRIVKLQVLCEKIFLMNSHV